MSFGYCFLIIQYRSRQNKHLPPELQPPGDGAAFSDKQAPSRSIVDEDGDLTHGVDGGEFWTFLFVLPQTDDHALERNPRRLEEDVQRPTRLSHQVIVQFQSHS